MRALLSVYDKRGSIELARASSELGWELDRQREHVGRAGRGRHRPPRGGRRHRRRPRCSGGRVKTLHPEHPRRHPGRPLQARAPGRPRRPTGSRPSTSWSCNLYPFSSDPSIELIDVGGPTMVRAAAKNHDHVGVVVSPADYGPVLDELRRCRHPLGRAPAAAWPAPPSPTPRPTTPPSSPGSTRAAAPPTSRGATTPTAPTRNRLASCPPTLHLTLERAEVAPLRREPAPARCPLPDRSAHRAGGTTWSSTGARSSPTSTSSTPTRPGGSSTSWRPTPASRAARWPSSSTPTRAGPRSPPTWSRPTSAPSSATRQSAFGGIVAIGGPVTAEVAEAIAAGPQADVIIAPSYDAEALSPLTARRKATRLLSGPAPEPAGPPAPQPRGQRARAGRRPLPVAPARRGACHRAPAHRGRVARPRARLAGLRPHDLQRHRRGERRPGGRRRRRPAVTGGGGRDRRAEGRASGPRAGAAASDAFFPFPDGLLVLAEAGVAAVVQPGGSVRDDEVIAAAATRPGSRWS